MLSPLDLKNKKIEPKKRKYYDKEDMDEYLELVFEQYKALYDENQELQKKVKTLDDGVQYYRSIETTMQKALVLAEKTAKETKDAASLKAEAIEKDANTKAEKIVSEAEQEYDKLKEKCLYLVQQFNQYKMQLKQVASAQLELITSDSFDVYSPELEAIQAEKTALPSNKSINQTEPVSETTKDTGDVLETSTSVPENNEFEFIQKEDEAENLIQEEQEVKKEADDFGKTTILPDVRKERRPSRKSQSEEDNLDILSADTIDLSSSLDQIREAVAVQKPKEAVAKEVQEALVLEPVDAVVTEPLDLKAVEVKQEAGPEVLELEKENEKEAPTLDSLLQSINIGKKNKKKKGQDEDPFEFLGSVDDF